jgi:hypothetical protein
MSDAHTNGSSPRYTLKSLAESGHVMGLETIREVVRHMRSHHYAYFNTERFAEETAALDQLIEGHEDDRVDEILTIEERNKIDREMDEFFAPQGKSDDPTESKE